VRLHDSHLPRRRPSRRPQSIHQAPQLSVAVTVDDARFIRVIFSVTIIIIIARASSSRERQPHGVRRPGSLVPVQRLVVALVRVVRDAHVRRARVDDDDDDERRPTRSGGYKDGGGRDVISRRIDAPTTTTTR